MRKTFTKGFTLIELLVVIAIIGILASIVLVSLNSARTKSRDANRVASLQEMAKAIQIADTDPAATITCAIGTSPLFNAATCTATGMQSLASFLDPSSGSLTSSAVQSGTTAGGLCGPAMGTATCQYSMATSSPTTQKYQICTYLESGAGSIPAGKAHVSNLTGGSVVAGCP